MEIKLILSSVWILLSLGAFIHYYYSILKWETKPHIYTWLIFSLSLGTAFIIQLQSGWGYGAYVTFIEFLWCFIALLLWLNYWEKNITKSDTVCLMLAVFTLFLYLSFKLAVISIILVIIIDTLAIIPTYRKSFHKPHEETIVIYLISAWVYVFAILWLESYSFTTYWYPLAIMLADIVFVLYILWRKKLYEKIHKRFKVH